MPANTRLVIHQRLQALTPATRQMLGVAAVLGKTFSYQMLEAIGGFGDDDDLLDAVEEAERNQVIIPTVSGGAAGYQFSHELMRHTLVAQLSERRRQNYHRRAAEAIEAVHGDDDDLYAAELARHLTAAGRTRDASKVVHYLTVAGNRAQAAAAHEEALGLYEEALGYLPPADALGRARLLLRIGTAQRSTGHWDDAVAVWNEALTLLEGLSESDEVASLCWAFARQLSWAYRFKEMADVSARGLAQIGDQPSSHRSRLLAMSALACGLAGQPAAADQQLLEAKQLADSLGEEALFGDVWAMETVHHYFHMQLPETVAAGRRAVPKLRASGSLWTLSDALSFLDVGYVFQGEFASSAAIHDELRPLAEKLGHWGAAAVVRRNEFVTSAALRGDLAVLEELSTNQLKVASETASPGWVGTAMTLTGITHLWRGKWPQAIEALEEGLRLAGAFWATPQLGYLILAHAFCGNRDEALKRLQGVGDGLPRPGQANLLGAWNLAILLAEAVGLLGLEGWAKDLYPLVTEALATGAIMRQLDGRLIQTSAGMVAAAAGMPAAADEHFTVALAQADELPHLLERPFVRHFYGRFLDAEGGAGEKARAGSLLGEAVDGYRALGMARHSALAQELLRTTQSGL